MADALSITAAQILALFLETFFAGINVVTFGMVVSVLVFKRPGSGRSSFGGSWLLVFIASALFIIAMFDALLQLTYVLYAFVWFTGEGGAEAVFDDISYWQDGMKTVNYCVQTSIADFMLVYRCHIVYESNWLLTVPLSILWLGGVATGLYTSVAEFLVTSAASNHLNTGVLVPLITSNISITLALNLIATSLIVWKIRRVQLAAQRVYSSSGYTSGNTSFGRVIRIIVESGALYSIGIIIFLPLYIVSSNAQIGVSDAVIQIIGISFNLIIVRIYQGRTIETTMYDQTFTSKSASQSNPSARAQQQTIRFRHTRTGESSGLDGEIDNDMVMGRVNDPISSSEDADKVLYEGRDFA